jgi:two-component system sensor histidine kinase BaeS
VSRFGAQPVRLRPERIEIGPLVRDMVGHLEAALGARRLALEARLDPGAGVLRADPAWLRRALWNLLTNAARFTPDGGRVSIESRAAADTIVVEVSDTGIGIAATDLEDIFEPFSSATGDPLLHGSGLLGFGARGLGLGLALARRIAEAHGGSVEATSAVGIGSRFALRLPRAGVVELGRAAG